MRYRRFRRRSFRRGYRPRRSFRRSYRSRRPLRRRIGFRM